MMALVNVLWQQGEIRDAVDLDEVVETNVRCTGVTEHKALLRAATESRHRHAPTLTELRAEDAGAGISGLYGCVEVHHASSNLSFHSLSGMVNGEITAAEEPIQDAQPDDTSLRTASVSQKQPALAGLEGPLQTRLNTTGGLANEAASAASPDSPEVAPSLISDIIEALGNNQYEAIEITPLTSPRAIPAELESIWSEDTSEVAPNSRKFRGRPSTPKVVLPVQVIHCSYSQHRFQDIDEENFPSSPPAIRDPSGIIAPEAAAEPTHLIDKEDVLSSSPPSTDCDSPGVFAPEAVIVPAGLIDAGLFISPSETSSEFP
jgi:hypothetical protein